MKNITVVLLVCSLFSLNAFAGRKPNAAPSYECGVYPKTIEAIQESVKNVWGKPEQANIVDEFVADCFAAYQADGTSKSQQQELKANYNSLVKMCSKWRAGEGFLADCKFHAMQFVDQLKGH